MATLLETRLVLPTIDMAERQLTFKFVYCGPPLAGKTTNLTKLYEFVDDKNRGRLMTLDGSDDRTLFFDLLPIFFRVSGLSVRIKVYTVPGQPAHRMTRRAVLRGVDGVVFVADSDPSHSIENALSYQELMANLEQAGKTVQGIAFVTQFNKRDLPGALPAKAFGNEPVSLASAAAGEGVLETFLELAAQAWTAMDEGTDLEQTFRVSGADFLRELSMHIHA